MITRVLIANRGEIARRIIATCARMGIGTVAVYSDADAGLAFVAEADVAVNLPGDTAADTYLRSELIIDAARRSGADAIHPGYGFLAESAEFAQAVIDAGLTWIGPSPEAIAQMGDKLQAKAVMEAAGVPTLGSIDPDTATAQQLPLMVKAAAGGGGRGMRVVETLTELPAAVAAASDEAASAFGDGTVFVEPYIAASRHIEVQIVGHPGGVLVLGERDCSVQRRHQKVLEEAPAPHLPPATRAALHQAAADAAAAIGYQGAGTVEFLYAAGTDKFYFLEMNTRLQVEHPVSELVHGVDLVQLQLRVAEGETLTSGDPSLGHEPQGHAIEVRLYAEDPAADYLPQTGRLTRFDLPADSVFGPLAHAGVRVDSGFRAGDHVTTFYDAMLAKLIVWAPTRTLALRQLAGALAHARIHGIATNLDQLRAIVADPQVVAGTMTTALLHPDPSPELRGVREVDPGELQRAGFAAAMAIAHAAAAIRAVQSRIPIGWRNVYSGPQIDTFTYRGPVAGDSAAASASTSASSRSETPLEAEVQIAWRHTLSGLRHVPATEAAASAARLVAATEQAPSTWTITVDEAGLRYHYDVTLAGIVTSTTEALSVTINSPAGQLQLVRQPRFTDPADLVQMGSLLAPMPGSVVAVHIDDGAQVNAGQPLIVLEAMKMQHTIVAPEDGVVTLHVQVGQQVGADEVLAVVSGATSPAPAAEVEATS